jgi:valyl-tRNA synthetase
MVKTRAYSDDESALYTLHEGLKVILKLMAPIIPFITDAVYSKIYGEKIHNLEFPEKFDVPNKTKFTQNLIDFNTMVWKKKKDAGLALNTEIKNIIIPKELRLFNDDLKKMHKLI